MSHTYVIDISRIYTDKTHMKKKHKSGETPMTGQQHHNKETYVIIDFECFQPHTWQSLGILVITGGEYSHSLEVSCDRSDQRVPAHTRRFWNKYDEAYNYNYNNGKEHNWYDQEVVICDFIRELKKDTPNFYLLSDSPAYDVSLLDDILLRNDHTPVSQRTPYMYRQSICTWSSKRMLEMLRISIDHSAVYLTNLPGHSIRHTPIADCMHIYNNYMRTLQAVDAGRQY
jgi:hypothetical protein